MTDGGTKVDYQKMRVAADKVDAAAETIRGLQQTVESHRAALAAGWSSPASAALQGVLNEWDSDFNNIRAQLGLIHQKLVGTQIHYQSTEQDEALANNKIKTLLNH